MLPEEEKENTRYRQEMYRKRGKVARETLMKYHSFFKELYDSLSEENQAKAQEFVETLTNEEKQVIAWLVKKT